MTSFILIVCACCFIGPLIMLIVHSSRKLMRRRAMRRIKSERFRDFSHTEN